jgi:hypothetical protein
MNHDFLRTISEDNHTVNFYGYTNNELEKISRLYDIEIKGQLKQFLNNMGKSDGGIIGDSLIQIYRPSWKVREHILFQIDFFNQMQEAGLYEYLNKPFVFSVVSETQYYFIQTTKDDKVYHYDSNNDVAKTTEWDLLSFLKILKEYNNGKLQKSTTGNLLEI